MGPDGGGVPCDYCAAQRALLYCAQHGGARLCLPCDVPVHAATAGAHERAPLCEGCHAAPAAALCAVHRASLCAHCSRAARCVADRHDRRPAHSYTGFPDPDDLARILYFDTPPAEVPPPPLPVPPDPDTSVPDLVNVELKPADLPGSSSSSRSLDEQHTMMNLNLLLPSSSSLIETGGNIEKQAVAGDGAAAALPTGGGEGDAGLFTQDYSDWYNNLADDFSYIDGLNLTAPLVDSLIVEPETAWWSSLSGYDGDPWPLNPSSSSYSSENVAGFSTDHAMESLAGKNAAFRLSSSVMSAAANTSTSTVPYQQLDLLDHVHQLPLQQGKTPNPDWLLPPHQLPPQCKFFNSGLPMWPPDEFPSRHLGIDDERLTLAALGSTTVVVHQDQGAPLQQQQQAAASVQVPEQGASQAMEARTKLQEKREEAKQRYYDKKKNRRFGKQIMYVSRKVRADTRNRVKGRFAKASSASGGGHGDDNQSAQHGHGGGL